MNTHIRSTQQALLLNLFSGSNSNGDHEMDRIELQKAKRHLKRNDSVMAALIDDYQPYHLEFENQAAQNTHFHVLVRTIINQQLSVKAAATIMQRLLKKQGGRQFSVKKLPSIAESEFRKCGISKNKTRYIREITTAVLEKKLNFSQLKKMDNDAAVARLTKLPGIGQWSADLFLMSSFKRLDVLPLGDLILRKTMQRLYEIDSTDNYDIFFEIAENWRPYRSVASRYLWAAS